MIDSKRNERSIYCPYFAGGMLENMKDPKEFCTCNDTKCPNHPVNHDKGCTLCIIKNLALDEIPSCFFNKLDDGGVKHGYTREDYARLVLGIRE